MFLKNILLKINQMLAHPTQSKFSTGLLRWVHRLLATLGLATVIIAGIVASQELLQYEFEINALRWLTQRHHARLIDEGDILEPIQDLKAIQRVAAIDPQSLKRPQALTAKWLSRRYKVAPEPVARIVQEAWSIAPKAKIEPEMLLALVAIESGFNPYAQSAAGAQGLTQVMTHIHTHKLKLFGGNYAVFDSLSNIKVGAQILKDCITKMGSTAEGLSCYVGAVGEDSIYPAKVLAEYAFIKKVSSGEKVSPRTEIVVKTSDTGSRSPKGAKNAPDLPSNQAAEDDYDADIPEIDAKNQAKGLK